MLTIDAINAIKSRATRIGTESSDPVKIAAVARIIDAVCDPASPPLAHTTDFAMMTLERLGPAHLEVLSFLRSPNHFWGFIGPVRWSEEVENFALMQVFENHKAWEMSALLSEILPALRCSPEFFNVVLMDLLGMQMVSAEACQTVHLARLADCLLTEIGSQCCNLWLPPLAPPPSPSDIRYRLGLLDEKRRKKADEEILAKRERLAERISAAAGFQN